MRGTTEPFLFSGALNLGHLFKHAAAMLDPQLVVETYLSLADAAPGKRPTRTVVGITWGVDEVNAFTQPRQDALLKEMQLDSVLGGADA